MTTNKPKVFRFHCHGPSAPAYSCNKPDDNSGEYVRLSDYEAMQAECQKMTTGNQFKSDIAETEKERRLRRDVAALNAATADLHAQNKALVEALEQYADDYNWCYDTCNIGSDVAKKALAAHHKQEPTK